MKPANPKSISPKSTHKSQPMATSKAQIDKLAQLRALAQHHLIEIEAEKVEEQAQSSQAESDIQRYAKISSFDRKRAAASDPFPSELQFTNSMDTKKERFRPFNEILHRLRWDPELDMNDYVVGYLERFEGIKEMHPTNWFRDFSDEDWIPMHRVRYLKRVRISQSISPNNDSSANQNGPELGIVWDRDGRIDKFSKSWSSKAVQEDIMAADIRCVDSASVAGGVAL